MYFAFVNARTGERESDDTIATKLLDVYGDHGGMEFELLTMLGEYCTYHGPFDMCKFDRATDKINLTEHDKEVFLYFLNGAYKYYSWR